LTLRYGASGPTAGSASTSGMGALATAPKRCLPGRAWVWTGAGLGLWLGPGLGFGLGRGLDRGLGGGLGQGLGQGLGRGLGFGRGRRLRFLLGGDRRCGLFYNRWRNRHGDFPPRRDRHDLPARRRFGAATSEAPVGQPPAGQAGLFNGFEVSVPMSGKETRDGSPLPAPRRLPR